MMLRCPKRAFCEKERLACVVYFGLECMARFERWSVLRCRPRIGSFQCAAGGELSTERQRRAAHPPHFLDAQTFSAGVRIE
jgi:hypothetical protein